MVQTLCRHCRAEIPYNTLAYYYGFCETCWKNHLDGVLQLDGCQVVTFRGEPWHRDALSNPTRAHTPKTDTQSPTWRYVEQFARRMEYKMSLHRDRGGREGWLAETVEWLFARGMEEGGEIAKLMTHPPEDREENWAELLADECADQANLWMMLADKALHDYPREKR